MKRVPRKLKKKKRSCVISWHVKSRKPLRIRAKRKKKRIENVDKIKDNS